MQALLRALHLAPQVPQACRDALTNLKEELKSYSNLTCEVHVKLHALLTSIAQAREDLHFTEILQTMGEEYSNALCVTLADVSDELCSSAAQKDQTWQTFITEATDAIEAARVWLVPHEKALLEDLQDVKKQPSLPEEGVTKRMWNAALDLQLINSALFIRALKESNDADIQMRVAKRSVDDQVLRLAITYGLSVEVQTEAFTFVNGDIYAIRQAVEFGKSEDFQLWAFNLGAEADDMHTIQNAARYGLSEKLQLRALELGADDIDTRRDAARFGRRAAVQLLALQDPRADFWCVYYAAQNPKTLAVAVTALTHPHADNTTAVVLCSFVNGQEWTAETKTANLQHVFHQVAEQGINNPHYMAILRTLYNTLGQHADAATRFNVRLLCKIDPINASTIKDDDANAATTAIVARYAPKAIDAMNAFLHPYATEHTTQALIARAVCDDASITGYLLQHATFKATQLQDQEEKDKCLRTIATINIINDARAAPNPA